MKVDLPTWSVRNPLGTIALFISLIYGTSALLLGASVGSLSELNQTILTIFVAVFPFSVLAVFGWLVSTHHKKLYGPGDYRTDEGFLQAAASAPPEQVGSKLREEATAELNEAEAPPQLPAPEGGGVDHAVPPVRRDPTNLARRAFFAETLVFQEFQRQWNGTVKRNVSLDVNGSRLEVDGIVQTPDGERVVEVAVVRNLKTVRNRLEKSALFLQRAASALPSSRLVLAIVADDLDISAADALAAARGLLDHIPNLELAFFQLDELTKRYGLSPDDERGVGAP